MSAPSKVEILVFKIAGRRFGVRGSEACEVLRAAALLAVSDPQSRLEGMLDLRGKATPVFNLRAWFDLPAKDIEPSDLFVVCRSPGELLVIRADQGADLLEFAPGEFEPVPAVMPTAGVVEALARSADGLVLVLDPARILATGGSATGGPASGQAVETVAT